MGLGQQAAEFLWGLGTSRQEDIEQEEYRLQQEQIAADAERLQQTSGDLLTANARDVSRRGLAETRDRYGTAASQFSSFADPILEDLEGLERYGEDRAAGLEEGYGDLAYQGRIGAGNLVRGQRARELSLMQQLEGAGDQERRDITQAYGAEGAYQQGQIGRLGLGQTGAATGARTQLLRARTGSLGRLEERLRGERMGLSERLSGETLNAQASALNLNLGLNRERLGAQSDVTSFLSDLRAQGINARTQLGSAGLQYEDEAFQNQLAAEEYYGFLPAQYADQNAQRQIDIMLDRTERQPPQVGTGAAIQSLAAREY